MPPVGLSTRRARNNGCAAQAAFESMGVIRAERRVERIHKVAPDGYGPSLCSSRDHPDEGLLAGTGTSKPFKVTDTIQYSPTRLMNSAVPSSPNAAIDCR